jgi:hypothetical protein
MFFLSVLAMFLEASWPSRLCAIPTAAMLLFGQLEFCVQPLAREQRTW